MDLRSDILSAFQTYCDRTGYSEKTASFHAANDGKFFDRIKDGGGCTIKTYQAVMGWFKENTPQDGAHADR